MKDNHPTEVMENGEPVRRSKRKKSKPPKAVALPSVKAIQEENEKRRRNKQKRRRKAKELKKQDNTNIKSEEEKNIEIDKKKKIEIDKTREMFEREKKRIEGDTNMIEYERIRQLDIVRRNLKQLKMIIEGGNYLWPIPKLPWMKNWKPKPNYEDTDDDGEYHPDETGGSSTDESGGTDGDNVEERSPIKRRLRDRKKIQQYDEREAENEGGNRKIHTYLHPLKKPNTCNVINNVYTQYTLLMTYVHTQCHK